MIEKTDNSTAEDELLGQAANEFFEAMARGEEPSVPEFATRYPSIAELIGRTFPALAMINGSQNDPASFGSLSSLNIAKELGEFQILHEIGRGGMGVVYEAEQLSTHRRVALKILPLAVLCDEKRLKRFQNEVRAAATLDHPHFVPVYEVGEHGGIHYYAMKLIRGQSLAAVLVELRNVDTRVSKNGSRKTPSQRAMDQSTDHQPSTAECLGTGSPSSDQSGPVFSGDQSLLSLRVSRKKEYFRRIAELGVQAAEALHHAHERGVVHRDIKPGNLLLDTNGSLWVTDFGLARIEEEAAITMTGDFLGTLRYMAPEQALGNQALIDHRIDIYSLGATLYELLTLQPAIRGDDRSRMLKQFAESVPTAPRKIDRSIPVELETIVGKAMENTPSDRYASAAELAADLRRFLAHEPIVAKRSTLTGLTVKWIRRYPVWAALIAVVFLSVSSLSIGALWHANRLARELAENEKLRMVSEELRMASESQQMRLRREKYLADIRLANRAMIDGRYDSARSRLEQYLPPSPYADDRDFPWHYLWQNCPEPSKVFLGHDGPVRTAMVAPKAALVISGGDDCTVRFYSLHHEEQLAVLSDFSGTLHALVTTPDEETLVTAGESGELRAWNIAKVADGVQPTELLRLEGHQDDVFSVAVSPDGKYLASAGADSQVLVWDLPEMRLLSRLTGHTDWVRCLDFSPDGRTLASVSHDDYLILWDHQEAKEIQRVKITDGRPLGLSVSFHPSGKYVATGCSNGELRIIRLSDYETVATIDAFRSWYRSLDFSADGQLLATAGNDSFVRLFHLDSQMQITASRTLPGHELETWCVRFIEGESTLLSCGIDGTIAVRHIGASERVSDEKAVSEEDHRDLLEELTRRRLTTSRDRRKLFLSGYNAIQLFDKDDLQNPISLLYSADSKQTGGAVSPDGRWAAALRWERVKLISTDQPDWRVSLLVDPDDPEGTVYSAIAFDPSRDVMATGTNTGRLSLVGLPSRKHLADSRPFEAVGIRDILYTPDGRFVAACFCNHFDTETAVVVIYDASTLDEYVRIEDIERLLAVSPDGNFLAMVNRDQSIQVWNIESQSTEMIFEGNSLQVISGDFSSDGKYLITTTISGPINLWSTTSGRLVLDIEHDLRCPEVVFGPGNSAYAVDLDIVARQPSYEYRHHLVPLLEEPSPETRQTAVP